VLISKPGYIINDSLRTVNLECHSPLLTGTVNIDGVLLAGQTLTAVTTNIAGNGEITYQWNRGNTVVGTNSRTYTVVPADVYSKNFTLKVTCANYSGFIESPPMLTGTIGIIGEPQTGQTLTAVTSNLDGSGDITYQWRRGTTAIGTNSNIYTAVAADEGFAITVTVTRDNYSGSITSDFVRILKLWPWNSSVPPIGMGDGDTVQIAVGASGTLIIPENTTVTITNAGTGWVNNTNNLITLNISENATVIWKANYRSSATNSVTIVSNGTLDVAEGNIYTSGSRAINTTSNSTIIVSGGSVSSTPSLNDATITSTSLFGAVIVSDGLVIVYGTNTGRKAINATGTLSITGGLVIAESLSSTTGSNGVVNQLITPSGTGTIIAAYPLGGSHASGDTTGLIFLSATGSNVSWGLRDNWETGINYHGKFYPVSGVSVDKRIVWDRDKVPLPASIATGSIITIARGEFGPVTTGASSTMTIPSNVDVSIVSQGTAAVNNGSNNITLDIGSNSKVTWKANYHATSRSSGTMVTISGTGTFNIIEGSITFTGTSTAVGTSSNSTIIVSGGIVNSINSSVASSTSNIIITAGEVIAGSGTAITSTGNYSTVTVSGGLVSSTAGTGIGISTTGTNSTITISGGVVSATTGISASGIDSTVLISGGVVNATTGTGISSPGTNSTVTVSSGVVSATTGAAINSHANGYLRIIDNGLVIARRNLILGSSGVITRNNWNALSGNGRIVGYALGTYNAGTTGTVGTAGTIGTATISNGLVIAVPDGASDAAVTWGTSNGQAGINTPSGFFTIPGVSVN